MADNDMRSIPPAPCPSCGAVLEAATGIDDPEHSLPEPGCLTVCVYCATVLVFAPDMSLRFATDAEIATAPAEALGAARYMAAVLKRFYGNRPATD